MPLVLETVHRRLLKAIKCKPHGETKFKLGKALCKIGSLVGIDLKKVFFKEILDAFGGHMRLIICGGAPIDPQILRDFDAFGIQIIFGYGLTETSPFIIINNDRLHLAESVGEPMPGVEAKIDNPNAEGVGEICVRGPMVMLGYYENEEATREVIDEEGFFHTGDLGRVDSKNHFYICGRSKNVIVTDNGKNIFPEELESARTTCRTTRSRRSSARLWTRQTAPCRLTSASSSSPSARPSSSRRLPKRSSVSVRRTATKNKGVKTCRYGNDSSRFFLPY